MMGGGKGWQFFTDIFEKDSRSEFSVGWSKNGEETNKPKLSLFGGRIRLANNDTMHDCDGTCSSRFQLLEWQVCFVTDVQMN